MSLVAGATVTCMTAQAAAPEKPNIIFVLVDDLGYGDLGSFYQNARRDSGDRTKPWHATPKLDRMAAEGARLTHHYCAAPVSAPSRASFLTGLSQGHANVRNNQFDKAISDNHTVGTVLRRAGYATAAIGKWGLHGATDVPPWPAHPLQRGFDYFFGYLRHIDGHEHYPKEQLYFAQKAKNRGPVKVWDNREDITQSLDKCYTTDLFTARAKKWIVDHRQTSLGQPFFIYLAYDTPHAVLELPTQPYPEGAGLKAGMQWLGKPGRMINTASGTPDSWIHPDYANATYDDDRNAATPEKPWPNVYKRYATSIRRIDDAVGDLLQTLKDLGLDKNTLVVFTSDNGPSMESYLPEQNSPEFFAGYGPFDGIKRDTWEGGMRVPVIARWPGRIAEGLVVAAPGAMWDWLPTFAEAARVPAPANADGISLLPGLCGREGEAQKREALYFEYFVKGRTPDFSDIEPARRGRLRNQMQAIRSGDYTGVRYDIKTAQDDFEIYDVVRDPKETRNLAGDPAFAAMQARFKALALQSRRPDTDAPRPYDNELMPPVANPPAKLAPGLAWRYCEGRFPWTPNANSLPQPKKTGVLAGELSAAPLKQTEAQGGALLFEGFLRVPADGEYELTLTTDTGAALRLHNALVIDADYGYKPGTKKSATARLSAGLHPLTLMYHNDGKHSPALSLEWRAGGATTKPIPAEAFAHAVE